MLSKAVFGGRGGGIRSSSCERGAIRKKKRGTCSSFILFFFGSRPIYFFLHIFFVFLFLPSLDLTQVQGHYLGRLFSPPAPPLYGTRPNSLSSLPRRNSVPGSLAEQALLPLAPLLHGTCLNSSTRTVRASTQASFEGNHSTTGATGSAPSVACFHPIRNSMRHRSTSPARTAGGVTPNLREGPQLKRFKIDLEQPTTSKKSEAKSRCTIP